MSVFKLARNLCRALLPATLWERLRKPWNAYKVHCVENICLQEMVRASLEQQKRLPLAVAPSTTALQRIVLIADVMWEANELVPELERICQVDVHDVRPVLQNLTTGYAPEVIVRSVESFIAAYAKGEPGLVILYLRGNLLSEELFSIIRSRWSCPLFGMNLDDKVSFWDYGFAADGDSYHRWASRFDLNLTNSKIASSWYARAGATCIYMPPAMRRQEGLSAPYQSNFQHTVSFVGSLKQDRVTTIERLRRLGIPVSVFGNGWPEGGWIRDPVSIYRSTQLNLGLGMATPKFTTTKNRDFECPGSGACYLTTFNWELAEWWDIGKEILCYRNTEELIEIISWYRNRPEDCLRIARAAWKRGISEHTWETRFRKVFDQAGLRCAH